MHTSLLNISWFSLFIHSKPCFNQPQKKCIQRHLQKYFSKLDPILQPNNHISTEKDKRKLKRDTRGKYQQSLELQIDDPKMEKAHE